jgi:hypothetical protein
MGVNSVVKVHYRRGSTSLLVKGKGVEVINFRGRPEHQVRGETDEFEGRAKTLDFPGRGLPAGKSGEAAGDRGRAEFFSATKRSVTSRGI